MILSFQKRFVVPISEGRKIHSFRLDPHDRWKAGNSIQYYIDTRTKNMKKFRDDGECKHIMHVFISIQGSSAMIFRRNPIYTNIANRGRRIDTWKFAINDGFQSTDDFIACIKQLHPGEQILIGKVIHWTDFRY